MKTPTVDYDIFPDHGSFHVHCAVDKEILDLYRKAKCRRLVIDYRSLKVEKLAALADAVEVLEIRNDEIADYEFINAFSKVVDLHTGVRLDKVDLGRFNRLRSLGVSNQRFDATALVSCKQLEELVFTGVKLRNSRALRELKKLRVFNLVRTSGYDLDIFESLTNLELLGIYNLKSKDCKFLRSCEKLHSLLLALSPEIETLDGLPSDAIKELSLRTCKNLRSIEPLKAYASLEKVILESCPKLESLAPLAKARKLRLLELWEQTNVADGKLRALLSNPKLQRFVFKDRKHYDLKMEETRAMNVTRTK